MTDYIRGICKGRILYTPGFHVKPVIEFVWVAPASYPCRAASDHQPVAWQHCGNSLILFAVEQYNSAYPVLTFPAYPLFNSEQKLEGIFFFLRIFFKVS